MQRLLQWKMQDYRKIGEKNDKIGKISFPDQLP